MDGSLNPDKFPYGDLVTNRVKIRIELDRRIYAGETATVSISAGFVTDGSTTSTAVTNLSITNESMWHDEVGELLTNAAKIVYVDPTLGNDATAAAANGGLGYYTKLSPEVGSTPSSPAGSILAYATIGAAMSVVSSVDHACVLLKRGETFDGATQYQANGRMLGGKSGTSVTEPIVYSAYGTGARPVLNPSANGPTGGNRSFSVDGTTANIVCTHLDHNFGAGTTCLRLSSTSTAGDYGNILFAFNDIEKVFQSPGTRNDGLMFRRNIGFCNNSIDNAGADDGLGGTIDYDDFMFREFEFYRNTFTNCGGSDLEHPLYMKTHADVVIQENVFAFSYGAPIKCDSNWGVEFSRNIIVEMHGGSNPESNGDSSAGLQVDRAEDTETNELPVIAASNGAYSKWITYRNNIVTNTSSVTGAKGLIGKFGQAYHSSVRDNILVSKSDNQGVGCAFTNEGGGAANGEHTRDGYGCKFSNNTLVYAGSTATSQWGVNFNCATTDDFSTNNTSKGHHEFQVNANVVFFGSGNTSPTIRAFNIKNDTYANAKTAGRLDGVITGNLVYREGGLESGLYEDGGITYSSIAAFEAVVADASGNTFADPEFNETGYQVSDYANSIGLTLSELVDAIAADYATDTITDAYSVIAIAAAVLSKHQANVEGKGVQDWASLATPSGPSTPPVVTHITNFGGLRRFAIVAGLVSPTSISLSGD